MLACFIRWRVVLWMCLGIRTIQVEECRKQFSDNTKATLTATCDSQPLSEVFGKLVPQSKKDKLLPIGSIKSTSADWRQSGCLPQRQMAGGSKITFPQTQYFSLRRKWLVYDIFLHKLWRIAYFPASQDYKKTNKGSPVVMQRTHQNGLGGKTL